MPSCFGRHDGRVPECRGCALRIRCAATVLDNVENLLSESIVPRVADGEDFGPYDQESAASCAHAAILSVASLGKPFGIEQVIQPYLARCRERRVRHGNARRNIRETLREMRLRGRITTTGTNKWRLA